MTHTGFYAGSFDPVTNGHMDIIARACRMVDKLVIGVGVHPGKTPLFPAEKRISLLKEVCASVVKETETIIEVRSFADLTIAAAQQAGASLLIRGVRDGSDCDYEMQLAGMNGAMAPDITTVFLPSSPSARHITATLVRQIAGMGGDVTPFVPPAIAAALSDAFATR